MSLSQCLASCCRALVEEKKEEGANEIAFRINVTNLSEVEKADVGCG